MPPDLSVVMIGRDEAATVSRALESVRSVARQIVFVDTGSTDDTVTIVKGFGIEVAHFAWVNDFAAARNAGLERAECAWVLVLDCDEELAEPSSAAQAIEVCCSDQRSVGYLVEIENLQSCGEVVRHQALRMFRNESRIRFSNPVHESVAESIYANWPDKALSIAPFRLTHYGYMQGRNTEKFDRNIEIMREWLEREPLNIYASYKYGASLQQLGKPAGLEWLGRGFELLDRRSDKATFPFGRALADAYLAALGRYGLQEEAKRVRERLARW